MGLLGLVIPVLMIVAIVMGWLYVYAYFTLRRSYPELWAHLFSWGFANIRFWKWVSDNKYAEIDDASFRSKLILLNRLSWLLISATGIAVTASFVLAVWKFS